MTRQFRDNKAIRIPAEVSTDRVKDLIQGSYMRNNGARDLGSKHGLKLDDSLSNAENKVYVDKKGNPTIAYTGSRKISDWLVSNPMLALGLEKYSPRFRRSEKVLTAVRKKYNKPIAVLGHSLGGAIASSVGKGNDKIITVDKGVGWGGVGKKLGSNETSIRTSNDIVSALSKFQTGGNKIEIKVKKGIQKSHKLNHLKRLFY